MKKKRYVRGKAKVGVAKGFGPRHAENAKEGDLTKVNTDVVPAMLTPREAVLNRNAAELAGRGKIEKLNAEGNQLAEKGVDLAAGGESDVGLSDILKTYQAGGDLTPEDIARVIAVLKGGGGGGEPSVATQVPKYGQYHEEAPELNNPNRARGDGDVAGQPNLPLRPGGFSNELIQWMKENPEDPDAVQLRKVLYKADPGFAAAKGVASVAIPKVSLGGTKSVSSGDVMKFLPTYDIRRQVAGEVAGKLAQKGTSDMKMKSKQSKPKPIPSGSPYVQGFLKQLAQAPAGAALPPGPPIPGQMPMQQPPQGYQGGGYVSGNLPGETSATDPYSVTPQGYVPSTLTDSSSDPYSGTPQNQQNWWRPTQAINNRGPGQYTPQPMPPQSTGVQPLRRGGIGRIGLGSGSFYPQRQGFATGTESVQGPIGTPPQGEQVYGPPVQLTSPQIAQLAKQTGISPTQIMGLMKAFQGGGQAYNSIGGGNFDAGWPAAGGGTGALGGGASYGASGITNVGYQGGISDIGYPPFLMPDAQYHADKGSSWVGPYDPKYLVQRFSGGTSYVSPFR